MDVKTRHDVLRMVEDRGYWVKLLWYWVLTRLLTRRLAQ